LAARIQNASLGRLLRDARIAFLRPCSPAGSQRGELNE
jgi:hypothetical protein